MVWKMNRFSSRLSGAQLGASWRSPDLTGRIFFYLRATFWEGKRSLNTSGLGKVVKAWGSREAAMLAETADGKERKRMMKDIARKISLCLLACVLAFTNVQTAFAKTSLPSYEAVFTPAVLVKEVTESTTSIPVYVYDDTTLYVMNGSKAIFQKTYSKEGIKTVKIKKQAGGSKLKFYLVTKRTGKKGKTVTRTVAKLPVIAPEKFDIALRAPNLCKCVLTNKSTKINVIGYKGTTLVISNGKKTIKTVTYKKNGEKRITIPKQAGGTLYFYTRKGGLRSSVVSREIKDVVAPKKPKLKVQGGALYVKGEIGAKVYFKGMDGWRYAGAVLSSAWQRIETGADGGIKTFKVYLKDAAGNKGKAAQVKNPNAGLHPEPIS